MTDALATDEVIRRVPTLNLIDDDRIRAVTARLTAEAPDYFWEVPASSSNYHHPACRKEGGLWAHTLMLSTVIERHADSRVALGRIAEHEVDYAHAAAILHDQRKRGRADNPQDGATADHDMAMAKVVIDSPLPDEIANAVAAHMGPEQFGYAGPEPETGLERFVHDVDMAASAFSITPGIQGTIPDELAHLDLQEVDLR